MLKRNHICTPENRKKRCNMKIPKDKSTCTTRNPVSFEFNSRTRLRQGSSLLNINTRNLFLFLRSTYNAILRPSFPPLSLPRNNPINIPRKHKTPSLNPSLPTTSNPHQSPHPPHNHRQFDNHPHTPDFLNNPVPVTFLVIHDVDVFPWLWYQAEDYPCEERVD